MKATYLGTACVLLEYGGLRIITDPVFDPAGTSYHLGPWYTPKAWFSSTRLYDVPMSVEQVGSVDLALVSHDHHPDNLDRAGRAVLAAASVVVTNPAAAKRLKARGIATGESTTVGDVRVTATPARHGPKRTPQVDQVTGFLLEAPGEPSVWISGDTVLTTELRAWLASHTGVGVAIVHAGGVRFAKAPVLGAARFTMPASDVAEAVDRVKPGVVIPVHRSGWSHFEDEALLRAALPGATWLELGETYSS